MDDTFLTTEEVLDYLQVNLRTVYRLIKAGKIPAVRVGRQWRFKRADLDAWLEGQRSRKSRTVAPVAAPAPASPERPRVLVVDDEASIRELLTRTLALTEYDVEAVADGRTGLDRLRLGPYDLLIADLRMPVMDGLDPDPRGPPAAADLEGDHHHRLFHRSERDRGRQSRRRRLPGEALPGPAGPGRRGARTGRNLEKALAANLQPPGDSRPGHYAETEPEG